MMSQKMAEEGANTKDAPSGIVNFKNNLVKFLKEHKRLIFIVTKSIELAFLCLAAVVELYHSRLDSNTGRISEYKNLNRNSDFLFRTVVTTFGGVIIFNFILLLSYLLGEQLPKKLLCIFSLLAAFSCISTAVILLVDTGDSNMTVNSESSPELITSGCFAIFAGLTFLIEACITVLTYS